MLPLHIFTVWLPSFYLGFLKSFLKGWTIISPCGGVQGKLSNLARIRQQNILEGVLPLVVNTHAIINPLAVFLTIAKYLLQMGTKPQI
jgi:hypothetical protein